MQITVLSIIIGFINFTTIAGTTKYNDDYELPKAADFFNKCTLWAFTIYIPTIMLHYFINGFDWGMPIVGAFIIAMSTHFAIRPQEERVSLRQNPREKVISKESTKRLYWAMLLILIGTFVIMLNTLG